MGRPRQRSITRLRRSWLVSAAIVGGVLLCATFATDVRAAGPQIELAAANAGVEVCGLDGEVLRTLRALPRDDPRWPQIFSVCVKSGTLSEQPAMLGSYEVRGDVVHFGPRFPLERGLAYRVVFDAARVPGLSGHGVPLAKTLSIPAAPAGPPTRVVGVYPSSTDVPENLLRVYLQFSAPMSQGSSYPHIHLRDDAGKNVDGAFLEVPQELWDPSGTRLTLLLDPGRVKSGLLPRQEAGPVLETGHTYTLSIEASWPDADGRPLERGFKKTYRVGKPATSQLDARRWKLDAPLAGSRQPLCVRFPEPLDRGMLERVLHVVRVPHSAATVRDEIPGTIVVSDEESRWSFVPRDPWSPGRYALAVSSVLEDRAGNNLHSAFEVDLNRKASRAAVPAVVELEFEPASPIRPAPTNR